MPMSASNLILNDQALSVYPVSFDFDLLTLTVFTTLKSIQLKVNVVSQRPNVKIVAYAKRKT